MVTTEPMAILAISVTPDEVQPKIHPLPRTRGEQNKELCHLVGCPAVDDLQSVWLHRTDENNPLLMWFDGRQADALPDNIRAANVAADVDAVRGTVAFSGGMTEAGDITVLHERWKRHILTVAGFDFGATG